ncbi:MAG TPA: S8 family serine peptidase [Xanthomonadaceae bacterium]|nr:S8 family serine peptidase [Xanthomonadaceae bacterium]
MSRPSRTLLRLLGVSLLAAGGLGAATVDANTDSRCLISFESARFDSCSLTSDTIDPALDGLTDPQRFRDSHVRVVKFGGPVGSDQRHALEGNGARILGYAPYHAYVVESPPRHDARLLGIPDVVWVGPFLPAWKVDPNLARDLGGSRLIERAGIQRIEVSLHARRHSAPVVATLARVSGLALVSTSQVRAQHRLTLAFDPASLRSAVEMLAAHEDVAAISLQWPQQPLNSQGGWLHQSGTPGLRPLFERGLYGCGETIGVADTGVHVPHCSFTDPDHPNPAVAVCVDGDACPAQPGDPDHRKIAAYYKWSGAPGSGAEDSHGHGTHVTGSALGSNIANPADCTALTTPGNLADVDGMAPGARLVAQELGSGLQYLNEHGGTLYHAASIAYGNGARIHNNSWGSGCRSSGVCIPGCLVGYRTTSHDADAVVWDFPELALFAAAGNSGSGCGPGADVTSPGNAKNAFSIGANLRGSQGENMWNGSPLASSRGPTADRRSKPDLVAQGSVIQSSRYNTACGTLGYQGTSMASPTAAGMAALVREYLRRGFHPSGTENATDSVAQPSAALIKAVMINGAHEIGGSGSGGPAPNTSQGWGQVRLEQALYFAGDTRRLWLADMHDGLQTGHRHVHLLEVAAGEPLAVTLVWHDYPALVGAHPHIVNRLRLEIATPGGALWTQKLSASGELADPNPFQDSSDVDYDDRNTVHRLRFDAPQSGTYTLTVRGIEVAMGDTQRYALAASGANLSGLTLPEPAPVLTAIDPPQVVAETGSFTLTASGSGFSPNASVRLDGAVLVTAWIDAETLQAEIDGDLIEWPGQIEIDVFTPAPGGGTSGVLELQILPNPDRVFRNGFET